MLRMKDMREVLMDVVAERPPEQSRIKYTDEHREFRSGAEERWKAALKENPNLTMEYPYDPDDED